MGCRVAHEPADSGDTLGSLIDSVPIPSSGRLLALVFAVLALVALPACGGDDEEPVETPDLPRLASASDLTGKTFTSTEVKGRDLVDGTEITISFGPGALTASAGCNSIRGAYTLEDGVIRLGKSAGTLIGCPDDRQEQDEWLTTVLETGMRAYGEGGELTLLGLGAEIELEQGAVPGGPPPVVGTTWELDSYGTGGTVANVEPGVRLPFIRFAEDDSFDIFDGCNEGTGQVRIGEGEMFFLPMTLTRKACPGLSGTVSRAMGDVLDGPTVYEFEGQNLVISRQGATLTFTPG